MARPPPPTTSPCARTHGPAQFSGTSNDSVICDAGRGHDALRTDTDAELRERLPYEIAVRRRRTARTTVTAVGVDTGTPGSTRQTRGSRARGRSSR